MFRANPSWNLSSDVPSSGMLPQGAAALLSLGFPCPSLPLVKPTLVCIFMFLLEHKAMENRDHGLLVIFGSQLPARVCIHKPINICWTKGKVTPVSPALVQHVQEAPPAFAWPSRRNPACRSDAGASATGLSSELTSWLCVFSGVPRYLKADLRQLKSKAFDTSKSWIFHST